MKEELQSRLINSLDKVQEYVEATESFVLEQAPLVAQEIVLSGRLQTGVIVVTFTLIIIAMLTVSAKCYNRYLKNTKDDGYVLVSVVMGLGSGLASMPLINALYEGVIPFFAPRLYLLQEISKLL
jgi:hypothetical protein